MRLTNIYRDWELIPKTSWSITKGAISYFLMFVAEQQQQKMSEYCEDVKQR